MSDAVKVAVIVAVGLVLATAIYVYFSPYQSCVRSGEGAAFCARATGGW